MPEKNHLEPKTPSATNATNQNKIGRHANSLLPNCVIWLTGLSGAGKSTIAELLVSRLHVEGHRVESLDGDRIRGVFPQTGFTRVERDAHVKRVGFMASRLEAHGVTVVASLISPYQESRDFVRDLCLNFVELHIATPLAQCEARDPKGLYARARRGEILNFTGVDDPYEAPLKADIVVDTSDRSAHECADEIFERLSQVLRPQGGIDVRA